jgi:hypothetical protein
MTLTVVRGPVGKTAPEVQKDPNNPSQDHSQATRQASAVASQHAGEAVVSSVRVLARPTGVERIRIQSEKEATKVAEEVADRVRDEGYQSEASGAHAGLSSNSARKSF